MSSDAVIVPFTGSEADALPHELRAAVTRSDTAALTSEMARGNEESFALFFDRYFNRLFRYLLAISRGDENVAKDALQDTLTRVAKHVRQFDDEKAFWDWLAVLARSAARDIGRKHSRYRNLLARFFDQSDRHSPPVGDSEERLNEALDGALKTLHDDARTLLEKKYFQRATVRELAREYRATEKSIESRLHRARRELRESINRRLSHE